MYINTKIQPGIIRKQNNHFHPSVIHIGDFDDDLAINFNNAFNSIINSPQPFVLISINSPGGSILELLAILDLIKDSPKPIVTSTNSLAASCGALLLSAGTKGYRYASPNSTIILHESSNDGIGGKKTDVLNEVAQMDSLNNKLMEILAHNSNKPKKFYQNMLKKASNIDLFLSPQQAKELNLIDFVGIPEVTMEISAKFTLTNKK